MTPGIWHTVTKASEDEEFQVGDRIRLEADGCISNAAAGGWMPAEDVPAATRGMECEPVDSKAGRIAKLRAELAALKEKA